METDSAVSAALPVLGIDIARRKFDVAVRAKGGTGAFKFKTFANEVSGFTALLA